MQLPESIEQGTDIRRLELNRTNRDGIVHRIEDRSKPVDPDRTGRRNIDTAVADVGERFCH